MAMRLIVTRGASAVEVQRKGETRMALQPNEDDTGNKWILKDWTYMIMPKLEVYRMSMPELVKDMRVALGDLYEKAQRLEVSWEKNSSPRLRGPVKQATVVSAEASPSTSGKQPPPHMARDRKSVRRITDADFDEELEKFKQVLDQVTEGRESLSTISHREDEKIFQRPLQDKSEWRPVRCTRFATLSINQFTLLCCSLTLAKLNCQCGRALRSRCFRANQLFRSVHVLISRIENKGATI
ncbi:hypothetical protein BDY19DRAFT_189680 [Irpex rosettiformis]|uniref:Uncharacterized protein n=1 Tax=Irpex rosettiformis TaxID=378272 RepID=A0ACB8U1X9_9APHY|nr:hypothetical protein BDY19DRAFT_189680 [Irpex rosettiformis]